MTTKMTLKQRLIVISILPLVVLGAYFLLGSLSAMLPADEKSLVTSAKGWMAIGGALYVINYVIAWKYWDVWPMTLGRSLFWAFVAYVCISNIVDLGGENWDIFGQILGTETPSQGLSVYITSIRARAVAWILLLVMSLMCILVGFEQIEPSSS